jgi:predicted HicB family RNase H-like nuclease
VARKQARITGSQEPTLIVTARVSPETHAALKAVADLNQRSISSHLRSLIEADVAQPSPEREAA